MTQEPNTNDQVQTIPNPMRKIKIDDIGQIIFFQIAGEVKTAGITIQKIKDTMDASETLGEFFAAFEDGEFEGAFYERILKFAEIVNHALTSLRHDLKV